jgi:hypothetical protein
MYELTPVPRGQPVNPGNYSALIYGQARSVTVSVTSVAMIPESNLFIP